MKNYLILEIRQGIGGNESIDFVKNLFKMYIKFFEKQNINFEILNNLNFKEVILKVENSIFDNKLLNESGIHRVQRIPKNETQGRIHTSTCSVFVANINLNNNLKIKNEDLKIETCRASGSGGQHVNKTNSAIKIIHLPTKISVECSDERSQNLNKTKALIILNMKILKFQKNNHDLQLNNIRKQIISNSERSKKIRTYNFTNNKVTDHVKNKNYFQLNKILNGELNILE
ncbi:peptide chain release factor-like protein [Candidatus Carsonella ruddii]|uniref:Putative peptide chain release factor A n=1 Tax=Candidatus Carsonella ruddii PC isolate NHV TaxID=1202540 RepID=J3YQM6_CARRU|nr:peptide chain release factor-like protein [Candidatus Carsonella ruddii]AFP84268.1 putative peptide chain release factor A [Candidatus Carsonella ruddii PC isolate NHV]